VEAILATHLSILRVRPANPTFQGQVLMATRRSTRRFTTRWRAVVEDFESSGLMVAEHCAGRQVSPGSFFQWRWPIREGGRDQPSGKPIDHRVTLPFAEAIPLRTSVVASPVIELRSWRVVVPDWLHHR
jgi:hypothetical protein